MGSKMKAASFYLSNNRAHTFLTAMLTPWGKDLNFNQTLEFSPFEAI